MGIAHGAESSLDQKGWTAGPNGTLLEALPVGKMRLL
jgi:hypothetical protein